MKKLFLLVLIGALSACNAMTIKPGTMQPGQTVYADRGGYAMRRAIKDELTARGYNVSVGTAKNFDTASDLSGTDMDMDSTIMPKTAHYAVKVSERSESFQPIWCIFNGFWWWRFNVSIADQKTGQELLSWSGRGCANSSIRKLDDALDKLEMK